MTFPHRPVGVAAQDYSVAGYWRIHAHHPQHGWREVSRFRDVPTEVSTFSFSDPFGAKELSLKFPQITVFDRRGEDDLEWCRKWSLVQLSFHGNLSDAYPRGRLRPASGADLWTPHGHQVVPSFTWSGYMSSFNDTADGLAVTCKGAMYSADGYLAKAEYPPRPLPYEWAIREKFLGHPNLPLRPLQIRWPDWWTIVYHAPSKGTPTYLVPTHVQEGKNWTGLLTRQTGNWDPMLSSYIQGLLSAMYTPNGRWTLDLFDDNTPVLLHRDFKAGVEDATIVIDASNSDAVELNLLEDWSQSVGAVFGQGTSLAGEQFSGMQVSADGSFTSYDPLAALRQVHPEHPADNDWLDRTWFRQEVMLQMQAGLDELQSAQVAKHHLRHFADPGITGTALLKQDVMMGGQPLSRFLVTAGMHVHFPGIRGGVGLHAHITENEVNLPEGTNELTFDSKFRDALTVKEVRKRGRDAMQIPRMLTVGQWQPPIPDQLVPWDYAAGSGYIPSHPHGAMPSALELFDEMPNDLEFPWTDWTRQRPPGHHKWRDCYIHIPPASPNASHNWAYLPNGRGLINRRGIPVRMAQAGQIRLTQIAAYDADGNVMPVPFHVSIYQFNGVNVASMPYVPDNHHYKPYTTKQRYPFGKDAWDTYNADGTQKQTSRLMASVGAGMVRGWGDHYEKAGYSPGLMSARNPATGLLIDETPWTFTAPSVGKTGISPYTVDQHPSAGFFYLMIYCDAQGPNDVYFLGRFFRSEPGTTQ